MNPPPVFPRDLAVDIRLDDDPRYKGSVHDDAVARARGYRAALVPGAFVYGHVSRLALHAWGEDWTSRGGMGVRFRRPVYDGDHLIIRAGPLQGDAGMCWAEVFVANGDGEEAAAGWIGLPDKTPDLPDLSAFSVVARPEVPPSVEAGGLRQGMPLTTANRILTEEDFRTSLRAFGETDSFYEREAIVHSGCLMRLAMGDTHNSFRLPSPVILTGIEAHHFAQARPGQRLSIVGAIAETYSRKGKHYFESEEFMLADGKPVARFLRTQIYAYDASSS